MLGPCICKSIPQAPYIIFLAFGYINGHERSTCREVQISNAMQMSLINLKSLYNYADVTESKFHKALPLSLPLQCLLFIGWVVLELWVLMHSIRLAVGE